MWQSSFSRKLSIFGLLIAAGSVAVVGAFKYRPEVTGAKSSKNATQQASSEPFLPNGRPALSPLPAAKEVWQCEVIVVGGSLGGIAAASQAMKSGAKTCLIELTPWLGGQISSQGVSALDESLTMTAMQNFSPSWKEFKQLIARQLVKLPAGKSQTKTRLVSDINSCWVSNLCFPPQAGAQAAQQLLETSAKSAPGSRWGTSIAFKGAEFDETGQRIAAVYAVRRTPRLPDYVPQGRLSQELLTWYSWSGDGTFEKVPIRLEAPPGKRLMVIDATDTGELVAWARIPYRVGSESRQLTGEPNAAKRDNPECTQAFTYPFVLALQNDQGQSRAKLAEIEPAYSKEEHRKFYSLIGFPMFKGRGLFNYRRIVSTTRNDPRRGSPAPGDMSLLNWSSGNDWNLMNPPLILTEEKLLQTGQHQNWMGGISISALKHGEEHALLFSEWLMETQSKPNFPLAHLSGADSPMGTISGLSMMPYIREGRRILGRTAYGQKAFSMRETDIRKNLSGGRNFAPTAIALTHYAVDIHGCLYRNWKTPWEAVGAGADHTLVRPTIIPLESLIPQGVDNLLIGGKSLAVTHIVNAVTRVHYGEWSIGAGAGATAGWLLKQAPPNLTPAEIVPKKLTPKLQQHLKKQGLRYTWN